MKWYENKVIIILLLICFFPVGLFLMWKHTDWQKNVKIIVSSVVAVVVILSMIFYQPESTPANIDTSSTPETSDTSSVSESEALSTTASSDAPTTTNTSEIESSTPETNATSSVNESETLSTTANTFEIETTTSADDSSAADSSNDETSKPAVTEIKVVSVTSPVARNETARLEIRGAANTEYTISVYYSTSASKAEGLEKKISNASGVVVWEWKVGGKTKEGSHRIVITGGGAEIETSFTTT